MIDFPVHHTVFFQFPKLERQHALGNSGADPPEFIKPFLLIHQVV